MARSLLDFAKSMERRAVTFGAAGNALAVRKAVAIVTYLAYHTPVDTSKALSNWQVSLGTPVMSPRSAFFIGLAGSTKIASAENTIMFAKAVLADKRPGVPIYISNVLPYIGRLDEGSSTQSPGNFADAAMLVARKTK